MHHNMYNKQNIKLIVLYYFSYKISISASRHVYLNYMKKEKKSDNIFGNCLLLLLLLLLIFRATWGLVGQSLYNMILPKHYIIISRYIVHHNIILLKYI